ncbi:hypothetical protein JOF28_002279 [Leucobacter exalbidus]|uniref:DNA modification methylase n=1 Tax=Leucobacter exalbidus TaxID=662960 RepID=A0A940T4B0_9MICO|nr:DNA modification methylase [Leucobacter exalbidus]MBP1327047.1 hypothetical protein [Leucobacter exalbidus]
MKIRIASSIALAAALALGATGCSLIAPQGTLEPYAPSDGVEVTIEGVDVRNLMLIADESGENFNVVFTAYNRTGADSDVTMTFVTEDSETASASFVLPEGTTAFGNPAAPETPVLVSIPDLVIGSTINAYFQVEGAAEAEHKVPVLDGTLAEYQDYVLPADFSKSADTTKAELQAAAEEAAASQSKIGDDTKGEETDEKSAN